MPLFPENPRLELSVLLVVLLIGTLGIVIPPYLDTLPEVRRGQWWEIEREILLSDVEPTFQLSIWPSLDDLRIEILLTNGTPVTVRAVDEFDNTYCLLTNVTKIENVHLTIYDSPEGWMSSVTIERQEEDSRISLRVKLWDRVPSDIMFIHAPDPIGFILAFFAVWRIVRLRKMYETWFLSTLAITIILGACLIFPWVGGALGGQFGLVYEEEIGDAQPYVFMLNESLSNVSIDLTGFDIGPDYQMRVRSLTTGGVPVSLSVQNMTASTLLTLTNFTGLGHCGLFLPNGSDSSYVLQFQRIVGNAEVGLVVESFRRVLVPYSDSGPSEILALAGIIFVVIGLLVVTTPYARARQLS
ncbi:MAG: hypothetical protein ACXADO_08375 [Candidatus Thorarchaeota archaeon]